MTMGLRRRVEKEKTGPLVSSSPANSYLDDIMPFIKKGTVIPIISNSMRIEEIFRDEQSLKERMSDAAVLDDEDLTIDEQLTKEWAREISYPMTDDHNLARVAQFYQVEQKETLLAKTKYLKFLTNYLLDLNEEEEGYKDIVSQLRMQEASFSEIVQQLDYPRFPEGFEDSLRVLAKLPLKIYVTTSYYNFIERALEAENKKPRTQVCFWSGGKLSAKPEHSPDPMYEPSDTQPAVYHLFGLEDYPQTIVLSEDDFMNFLISVVEDTNTQSPVVPLRLREGLAESRLLLLGYHVRGWDFRVLFRFILKYRSVDSAPRGMLIQLNPGKKQTGNKEKSVEYLSHYFDKKQFDIDWTNPEKFIQKLWNEWDKYRKGQS
jgi:hypothetical protein